MSRVVVGLLVALALATPATAQEHRPEEASGTSWQPAVTPMTGAHAQAGGWAPGIGGHLNLSMVPPLLAPRYGGRVAPGLGVFLNLQPSP